MLTPSLCVALPARTPTKIRRACYLEFKKAFGEKARKILQKYRLHHELSGVLKTTVGRRKQQFKRTAKDMQQLV